MADYIMSAINLTHKPCLRTVLNQEW